MGTGTDINGATSDLWKYNPATNRWALEYMQSAVAGGITVTADQANVAHGLANAVMPHPGISVYPNPAKDILHVQTTGTTTFIITDQSGKILISKTIADKGEINISNLSAGLYYIKNIATGERQKVVVTR